MRHRLRPFEQASDSMEDGEENGESVVKAIKSSAPGLFELLIASVSGCAPMEKKQE